MQEDKKKRTSRSIGLYIFECVMAFLYLVVSFILLFTTLFQHSIPNKNLRLFLGILLGFYGVFRIYRAIRKSKNENNASN